MKREYEKPSITFVPFDHKDRIAASGGPICYPIWSNTDTTGDNICDDTPKYVGKTN
jgi:hypothetical protein